MITNFIKKKIDLIKKNNCVRGFISLYRSFCSLKKTKFGYISNSTTIDLPVLIRNPGNIFLYDNTKIGANSVIVAINAKFIMKKFSGAADGFMVRTGNHMMVVGKFYRSITEEEKAQSKNRYDKDIIVEEDVWIGCNVTLLAGACIGRGSIVGAGAVVNKKTPPYSLSAGVPARFIKFKWTIQEIIEHEKMLYPVEERLSDEILKQYFNNFKSK